MCQSSQPTQQQVASTELPEWAKPYAKDILSKGQALTDVNQNPYQTYTQPRIAGFSPMQQQAMQGAAGMTVAPQVGEATAGATMAGMGGLGVAGQANPYGFQSQVGGYMNPYLQMSLAPQLAEANRQYDIGATKQQSAATQAGAFGGSREAIMAAENERNRNMALNQIVGQGYNTAFGNAQQQYNQNLQNQLAGYGLMNQSAANLGQLGQTQYGQQMGINQLQAQYGGQQQALEQQGLTQAYQDFLNQQNYPYKQLGFMSDMIRGLPLGQQSTSAIYQAPPTTAQTLGALGLGAYGVSKMMADGGEVKTYAGDEGSVTSEDNVRSISRFLPAKQLPASLQLAHARGDMDAEAALQKQMAENASIQRGLGGAFNALPPETQDGVVRAAGGGILAFAKGGDSDSEGDDGDTPDISSMFATRVADPKLQAQLGARQLGLIDYLTKHKGYVAPSREDRLKYMSDYSKEMQDAMGASPYGGMKDYIQQQIGGLGQEREEAKGLAALEAIPAILQPGGTLRGLGAAAASVGSSGAKIAQAQRTAKQQLNQMQFNLADAERKERMGLHRDARAAFDAAQANAIAADKADVAAKSAAASATARTMAANKVTGAGAGKGPKPDDIIIQKELQLATMDPSDPKYANLQKEVMALRGYQGRKTPGIPGVEARVESAEQIDFNKRFQSELLKRNPDIRKAQKAGDTAREAQIRAEAAEAARVPPLKGGAPTGGAPAPVVGAQPIYATNGKERIVSTDNGQTWKPVGAP